MWYVAVMPDAPSRQLHIRLDSTDLRERLDAYCVAERRNITQAVNWFLDQALTAYETKGHGTPSPTPTPESTRP